MTTCKLEVTQEELDAIKRSEVVVIEEWEREDGSRFGHIVDHGDDCEMKGITNAQGVIIVPNYLKYIGRFQVPVSELIE